MDKETTHAAIHLPLVIAQAHLLKVMYAGESADARAAY